MAIFIMKTLLWISKPNSRQSEEEKQKKCPKNFNLHKIIRLQWISWKVAGIFYQATVNIDGDFLMNIVLFNVRGNGNGFCFATFYPISLYKSTCMKILLFGRQRLHDKLLILINNLRDHFHVSQTALGSKSWKCETSSRLGLYIDPFRTSQI